MDRKNEAFSCNGMTTNEGENNFLGNQFGKKHGEATKMILI